MAPDSRQVRDQQLHEEDALLVPHVVMCMVHQKAVTPEMLGEGDRAPLELRDNHFLDIGRGGKRDGVQGSAALGKKCSQLVPGDGRDITDLEVAIDVLMKEILRRVRRARPDVLIEFRQSYTGPLMRTYGNLFRAGDCPGGKSGG